MKHHETLEHSPFRYRRSMQRHLRSARRYRRSRGVSGDCGVGITPQMCNRVTNHGDMDTFSKPMETLPKELYSDYFKKWNLFTHLPDRKKYSLLKDKYLREDSIIRYFHSKSLNMRSEWRNIKECNKYQCAILNIRGHGGQLMMNPFKYIRKIRTALSHIQKWIRPCFVPIPTNDHS